MCMAKTVELNIAERLYALGLMNQVKGDRRTVAQVDLDSIPVGFTLEEREKIKLRDVKNDEGKITSIQWEVGKAKDKKIEFSSETVEYLKKILGEKDKAGEFTIADRPAFSLLDKLNT